MKIPAIINDSFDTDATIEVDEMDEVGDICFTVAYDPRTVRCFWVDAAGARKMIIKALKRSLRTRDEGA